MYIHKHRKSLSSKLREKIYIFFATTTFKFSRIWVGLGLFLFWLNSPLLAIDSKIKNILFIISDDLKASALGVYGNDVCKTPNIDALAKDGMVFTRAYCQGVICRPSRKSFMYSRYKKTKGLSLGEHLKNSGLFSARVGKVFHMGVPGDIMRGSDGLDVPSAWTQKFNSPGPENLTVGDYACLSLNEFTRKMEGRQAPGDPHRFFVTISQDGDGSDQADHKAVNITKELLGKHREKAFFIAMGLVRPHYPHVAPKPYFDMYPWQEMKVPEIIRGDPEHIPQIGWSKRTTDNSGLGENPDNIKRMWSAYYATVTYMDFQVGRVLAELERLGLRESTAIIFTSDHGYHLGEHTFWEKNTLHEEATRVPLIISIPGMKGGSSKSLVELVDIYPTICDLLGVGIPKTVQGKSLVPILMDPTAKVKDVAVSITDKGVGLRFKDCTYIQYKNGEEEFYDMIKDSAQLNNLAYDKTYTDKLRDMRKAMAEKEISLLR